MADLRDTNVVMLGLGSLGGGAATVQWLLRRGARVTVADRRDGAALEASVRRVHTGLKRSSRDGTEYAELVGRLRWALGSESGELLDGAGLLVMNPAIAGDHPLVEEAMRRSVPVTNEANLFYGAWKGTTVGVTGTRGKTTTVRWANHLIARSAAVGNSPESPMLAPLGGRPPRVVITELPSYLLERFVHAPRVAVITNLTRDHLDRHGSMERYAEAKAAVFRNQQAGDTLILNADDPWTPRFTAERPAAAVSLFSHAPLAPGTQGIWCERGAFWQRAGASVRQVIALPAAVQLLGRRNLSNLMAAVLAARTVGVGWAEIARRIRSLPAVPFRQEVVHRNRRLTVINDTAATSPEGCIAALERWGGPSCILICGGTDRRLDFGPWADAVRGTVPATNLVFLAGTATVRMRGALGTFARGIRTYDSLPECVDAALTRAKQFVNATVLFSPGAKSFGTFAHEYERGKRFNDALHACLRR
jgi:UDP-N-acetylmuramoylalanine--D-glutamate ligase